MTDRRSFNARALLVALVLACSALPAAHAATPELRTVDGKVELSLSEAIEIALENNLALQIERYNRRQFELGITQAEAIFDLQLSGFAQTSESTSPTINPTIQGAAVLTSERQILNLGLDQLDPIGGQASFSFDNSRTESNSQVAAVNPAFSAGISIDYTLPLLQSFGKLPTQRGIMTAKLLNAGSIETFEQQVESIILQVENAYWDVVEAIDQLEVSKESLELARELHRRNGIQVEVGTMPPLELVRSEANIATQEDAIIGARTRVGDSMDALRQLLNFPTGPLWEQEIAPTTDPRMPAQELDLDEAIDIALRERPDLARARLELERLEIEEQFAKNQKKPRLDLGLSYGLDGLGGDLFLPNPETGRIEQISGGYGDALEQVQDADFDNWSVSLTFAYPLQNRAAKAAVASASLDVDRSRAELRQLEQQVITDVRRTVRGVEAAAQQIRSSEVSRELQEKNLDAEQKRYENGMSTSFEITQVQEDLTLARSREVQAIAGYRRALAAFYQALGRLIEETGVVLEGAEVGEAGAYSQGDDDA